MLLALPVFAGAAIACLAGIYRFRYWPLVIPAAGYLSWVAAFLLFTGVAGPLSLLHLGMGLGLAGLGGASIVGYGLTYNRKMKALGITPKRLLGLKGGPLPPRLSPPDV